MKCRTQEPCCRGSRSRAVPRAVPVSPASEHRHIAHMSKPIRNRVKKSLPRCVVEKPTRQQPTIIVQGGGLSREANEGERALRFAGAPVYQRGLTLTRPVMHELDAADGRRALVAQLTPIELPYMLDLLCRCAIWRKFDRRRDAEITIDPPSSVAQVILHRKGEWGFPSVVGIITTPTMRPDGSLLVKACYDAQTRLILVDPPPMPPISVTPTRGEALAALSLLESLLEEFPFTDEPSRSVALSALITPVVRGAFSVAPMHVISAPDAAQVRVILSIWPQLSLQVNLAP